MAYLRGARGTLEAETGPTALEGMSHIIPDVLYPAVSNVMLDGSTALSAVTTGPNSSTVASSKYGTVQSDGRMYYYTDIKGSKPIKDPRIGAHFGSQRHKIKSKQLLEQETATHGANVYSIDGREWLRGCGTILDSNDTTGHKLYIKDTASPLSFIEITGYFSDINLIGVTDNSYGRSFTTTVDGGSASGENTSFETSVGTPIGARYVDAGSVANMGLGATLGIHTLKLTSFSTSEYPNFFGIELIAQDTTSTATKSQIQIPSQNVVSLGKKFTVAGTPHYNPFATKGDDSASTIPNNTTGDSVGTGWTGSTSAYWDSSLDTATSLGLETWESGGNYYRPVNGGRVVKWVDSTGAIKTSVNMMPPEAHSIKKFASPGTCDATGTHNWSTQYKPQFGNKTVGSAVAEDDAADDDTGDWTVSEGSLTFDTDHYEQTSSGTGQFYIASDFTALTSGKLYQISVDVKNGTASGVSYKIRTWTTGAGGGVDNSPTFTTTGAFVTHTFVIEGGTQRRYGFQPQSSLGGNNIEFKNISLSEIEEPSLQAEVAKSFWYSEFGNGAANGGTAATYADASELANPSDDIAYVMDDGLTSLSCDDVQVDASKELICIGTSDMIFNTFIGTGVTIRTVTYGAGIYHIAQNLPYGTHILKILRNSTSDPNYFIDGVDLGQIDNDTHGGYQEITFDQPKRPPIPEDAVVLADYMLMADFVKQTATSADIEGQISKGVRFQTSSRDIFYNSSGAFSALCGTVKPAHPLGLRIHNTNASSTGKLPFFGTAVTFWGESFEEAWSATLGGSTVTETHLNNTGGLGGHGDAMTIADGDAVTLGMTNTVVTFPTAYNLYGLGVVTPIHTSHHYQAFETPYLYELVGGDRNMEQTNLVVTPDGKTWDEVTRNTSYLGNFRWRATIVDGKQSSANKVYLDEHRGQQYNSKLNLGIKDFTWAYEQLVCLVDGQYQIEFTDIYEADAHPTYIGVWINGTLVGRTNNSGSVAHGARLSIIHNLSRGDDLYFKGTWGNDNAIATNATSHWTINKV